MSIKKKTAPVAKSAIKPGNKTVKKSATKATTTKEIDTKRKTSSPPTPTPTLPLKEMSAFAGADSTSDQEPAHGRVNDVSDMARDKRLRKDLEYDSGRSSGDRHRERLTAVEPEEDGVRDDDDDGDPAADKREAAINELDADDDRA